MLYLYACIQLVPIPTGWLTTRKRSSTLNFVSGKGHQSWGFPCPGDVRKSRALFRMAAKDVGIVSASKRPRLSADHAVQSNQRRRLEYSFPLDALLPELHAKNVLTDYEFTQLLPTPQSTLVDRNRKFLDYLANKGPSSVSETLSVLFRHQYEAYGYFGDMLRQVFSAKGNEGKGMRGKTSRKPQQGGERSSDVKEVSTLRPSHSSAVDCMVYEVECQVE